jgi:hypothetical protein
MPELQRRCESRPYRWQYRSEHNSFFTVRFFLISHKTDLISSSGAEAASGVGVPPLLFATLALQHVGDGEVAGAKP